ncbi:DNA primase (type) [Streptococcus pyogenes]|nr:DNA primase (type) [Streptococcus pyogenes]VGQ73196.1 DNA primase (type) [Streptococcus pyogenes]VGR04946.1 DNA primase (type) [Streptococcus pyogenes]VGR11879.1 DNA primase (type) [Streptococcus pyogenes]VGW12155.1 DNA primase [Streptococcus pyogenes]
MIDFVQLVTGVTFKEAVSYLETGDFEQTKVIEEAYQPFQYYLHEEPFQQACTYLNEVRGLSDETINTFGRQGVLAQATYQSEPVLVLKSYDHNRALQAASLQGLVKNEERHKRGYLKKIMKGSHGHVGISFDIGNPKLLIFCESVIDMMSYYQLQQRQLSDVRLISMDGLKFSVIAYQTLRLAEKVARQEEKVSRETEKLENYRDQLQTAMYSIFIKRQQSSQLSFHEALEQAFGKETTLHPDYRNENIE